MTAKSKKASPAKDRKTKSQSKRKLINKEALGKETKSILTDMRYGRSISLDFFRANAWLLVIFIGGMVGMMGLRYKNKTKMAEIKQLEIELTRARSSKLKEKAEYMSLIRETEIKRLVEEKHLGLIFQEDPAVTVPLDGD